MAAAINVLPDILILIGLALLGYGLFLFAPWIAFSVVGGLLFGLGLAMATSGNTTTGEHQ